MAVKATKEAAQYTSNGTEQEHCSVCYYFIPDRRECKKTAGRIAPGGWCKFFERLPRKKAA